MLAWEAVGHVVCAKCLRGKMVFGSQEERAQTFVAERILVRKKWHTTRSITVRCVHCWAGGMRIAFLPQDPPPFPPDPGPLSGRHQTSLTD